MISREISINQVEYSTTSEGSAIHVFGRDTEGKVHHAKISGFRPYFYALAEQVDGKAFPAQITDVDKEMFHSIRGEKLRRLYTRKPVDVRDIRDRFHHFEADIPFATRFMIDLGLSRGIKYLDLGKEVDYHDIKSCVVDAPARVCIMDIECFSQKKWPDPERDAIVCVTCWDSYTDQYLTLTFPHDGVIEGIEIPAVRENHRVVICKNEKEMTEALVSYIQSHDPDVLTGWNFVDFDMPYIVARMERVGVSPSKLARLPGMVTAPALRGRAIFDLLQAYKKMHHQQQKESYRLDAVALDELGEGKVRYTGTISDLWENDLARLVEYNFKDVELCVKINQKNHIVDFYREIARYVGMPLDRTLNSSVVVDMFVLHKVHDRFVLPSKGVNVTEEFEGATVFEPSKGVRGYVVVLDLRALYPMIMITVNASIETKDPNGELRTPSGARFKKEPDGLVRTIVRDLLVERDEKKRLRNSFSYDSPEYKVYDMQQDVLKVIMNTYYGASGYSRFRLFDRDIGAAVTSVGRAILEHTRRVIEGQGFKVIYGDTDGCAVHIPDEDFDSVIKIAKNLEKILNESYGEFAKRELNADVQYFSTKFEKMYSLFFQAGKKKRYAGRLVWKEGKVVDDIDVVGFEVRRSDSPQVTRIVMKEVMRMILYGEGHEAVKGYLRDVVRKYRSGQYPLDETGIPGGIGKALDDYAVKDAHVRGAVYANEHLGTEFGRGSKPKRVYIKSVSGKYPRTDVIDFEYADQVPKEFVVDIEKMLEKTIRKPIERIVSALGWNWMDFDPTMPTLSEWGIG